MAILNKKIFCTLGDNQPNDPIADQQLVAMAMKGDEPAMEILVKRYLKLVYNIARNYCPDADDASDIAQEAFIKIWKNLKHFDQSKKLVNWIYEITKNTALDWLKKKKAIPLSSIIAADGNNYFLENMLVMVGSEAGLANQFLAAEFLKPAIVKLSPAYQEVVTKHYRDGMTFSEIANDTNESINTVKSRYRRALILLRQFLNHES